MNREDFKVDQTVYILLIGNAAVRKTDEECRLKIVNIGWTGLMISRSRHYLWTEIMNALMICTLFPLISGMAERYIRFEIPSSI